jgi:hypothetical protein
MLTILFDSAVSLVNSSSGSVSLTFVQRSDTTSHVLSSYAKEPVRELTTDLNALSQQPPPGFTNEYCVIETQFFSNITIRLMWFSDCARF